MAQGAPKKTPTTSAATSKSRANKPQPPKTKKGARVCKSKKGTTADRIQKKYAAGLVGKTEKLLGERAGHLELIGRGKKARSEDKADNGKDGKKNKTTAGGTRKFG